MIVVIKCLVDNSIEQIPVHNYKDIKTLEDRFPFIKRMEPHAHNIIELLQMFVKYISSGYYSAHLEDDGRRTVSKEMYRAEQIKNRIYEQTRKIKSSSSKLNKSSKDTINQADDSDQGIVSQIKPQSGKFAEEGRSYKKRFSMKQIPERHSNPYNVDLTDADSIESHKIDDNHWHHIGIKGNNKYHILSNDKNPYSRGLAGILTASNEGKNYIRSAFSDVDDDSSIDLLRSHIKAKPEHEYTDPIEIDATKHAEKGWENHHSDLIHGLVPDKTLQAPPNTVSSFISFAGVKGDTTPRVVAKESLRNWERRAKPRPEKEPSLDEKAEDHQESRKISFFDSPQFSTAHREAAYAKLAHNIFNLGEYVPRTTVFRHPLSDRPWSAMEFIPGATPITPETRDADLKHLKENGDLYKLAIMNMVLGNNDRHMNNILKDPSGRIHLIDHGLTFDYGNQVRTASIPKYIHDRHNNYSLLDDDVPESVHHWLQSIDIPKLANSMHEMRIPHDIIMNASQRLADARGWSSVVKHGAKDSPDMNKGLRHLFNIMKARSFNVSLVERNDIVDNVMKLLKVGDKGESILADDKSTPTQNNISTEIVGDSLRNAATMPLGTDKTAIADDVRTSIKRANDESIRTKTSGTTMNKKNKKR